MSENTNLNKLTEMDYSEKKKGKLKKKQIVFHYSFVYKSTQLLEVLFALVH